MDNNSILSHTDEALQRTPTGKALVKTYALWAVGVCLGAQLISYIAGLLTANTGGLGGIGMRSILETVQVLCMYLSMILLPFLLYGHMTAGLYTARGAESPEGVLFQGFRKFGPLLRLGLLWMLLIFAISMAASNAAAILYMFVPGSTQVMLALQQSLADPNALMDPQFALEVMGKLWPMYVIFGLILIALLIPLFYRLRLVTLRILDGDNRVILAMFTSWKSMRGHCKQLFFLDLRFWGYYALSALACVVAYGDQLLGITGDVAYWVCILLSLGIQILATILYLPRLHTAQAQFYLTYYITESQTQS
jgi:hypothetical protein